MELARRRAAEGATVLAWDEKGAASLAAAGIACEPARRGLGPDVARDIDTAARTWARVWGRRPLVDGRSFREIFEWKGASLWWMTESFLRTADDATSCVKLAETWLRILDAEKPDEVEAMGLPETAAVLLERAATVLGVLFHGRSRPPSRRARVLRAWLRSFRNEPRAAAAPPRRRARFVVVGEEGLVGPLGDSDAGETILRVPLQSLSPGRSRAARREAARGRVRFRRAFAGLRRSPGVHEAFSHRGVHFYDLAEGDLANLTFVALPRAVLLFEEMRALLAAAQPEAAAILVPSRDERRTLLAACAAAEVPTVVLRSGDDEEPERSDGGPRPELVLAWNGSASPEDLREALREVAAVERGAIPTEAIPSPYVGRDRVGGR
jgi:hypothetical protein